MKPYKRVLIKLSGEALMGDGDFGISISTLFGVADEIKKIHELGIQIGIVVGGGNIFRGFSASKQGIDRVSADYMGMLATVMNSIALCDALEKKGVTTRVQSAIKMEEVAETFIIKKALRHFEKGRIVIFAAGTGNPYFTTDTAAVLRGKEINADLLIKATKVNGVYDSDPEINKDAKFLKKVTFMETLEKKLHFMDMTAISLAMDNSLSILVLKLSTENQNIYNALKGGDVGTLISE